MSSTFSSYSVTNNDDLDRKPTAQELAEVPRMSKADVTKVMKDPSYKSSKLAQALVAASIQKGFLDEIAEAEEAQTMDEIQAKHASFRKLFKDPRYGTDPEYRYEVQQKLKAMTVEDNTLDDGAMNQTNQVIRVGVSTSPNKGADLSVYRYHRVDLAPKITTSEAPAKKTTPKEHFSE
jgi:tellurite resistance protein